MQADQRTIVLINVVGGCVVLGSYLWGFIAQTAAMGALWGGVPEAARGIYTVNMFLAAGGYFLFTPYLVFRWMTVPTLRGPENTRWLSCLYLAILVPSAMWLPLTALMLENPGALLWLVIRVTLVLVGAGAVGLLWTLARTRTEDRRPGFKFAVVGLLPFILQTAILDAIVWPIYFVR